MSEKKSIRNKNNHKLANYSHFFEKLPYRNR
jgi:hypothetical protein